MLSSPTCQSSSLQRNEVIGLQHKLHMSFHILYVVTNPSTSPSTPLLPSLTVSLSILPPPCFTYCSSLRGASPSPLSLSHALSSTVLHVKTQSEGSQLRVTCEKGRKLFFLGVWSPFPGPSTCHWILCTNLVSPSSIYRHLVFLTTFVDEAFNPVNIFGIVNKNNVAVVLCEPISGSLIHSVYQCHSTMLLRVLHVCVWV